HIIAHIFHFLLVWIILPGIAIYILSKIFKWVKSTFGGELLTIRKSLETIAKQRTNQTESGLQSSLEELETVVWEQIQSSSIYTVFQELPSQQLQEKVQEYIKWFREQSTHQHPGAELLYETSALRFALAQRIREQSCETTD